MPPSHSTDKRLMFLLNGNSYSISGSLSANKDDSHSPSIGDKDDGHSKMPDASIGDKDRYSKFIPLSAQKKNGNSETPEGSIGDKDRYSIFNALSANKDVETPDASIGDYDRYSTYGM